MKTVAVAFGDGRFKEYATAAVKRFEKLNDVEGWFLDIESLPRGLKHPSWAKAWIWNAVPHDVERVIWIDADVVPVRPIMDVVPDFAIPFCGVRDIDISRQEAEWDQDEVRGLRTYFNAGVFVVHRSTERMFREWQKEAMIGSATQFIDQTPLNLLLAKHFKESEIHELPRDCNWLLPFGPIPADVRMVHFAGWPNEYRDPMLRLLTLLESKPVQGDRIERGVACVENW